MHFEDIVYLLLNIFAISVLSTVITRAEYWSGMQGLIS
jgi:hypothetical protein